MDKMMTDLCLGKDGLNKSTNAIVPVLNFLSVHKVTLTRCCKYMYFYSLQTIPQQVWLTTTVLRDTLVQIPFEFGESTSHLM